ncbi:hypothetical protein Tco_1390400 [Tanacetum coccineum]
MLCLLVSLALMHFILAIEFGVAPYVFFPSTAMALSLFLHLPKVDQMVSCEYRDLLEPVQIPECIPFRGIDLLDPMRADNEDATRRFKAIVCRSLGKDRKKRS